MKFGRLICLAAVIALGSVPAASSALAAGHGGGHGGGGHGGGGHAMAGRGGGGHGHFGGGHRYVGGRRFRGGYGGYGGGYGCNDYYGYNGCGYNPGAAIVGGLIGGALNRAGVY
jgi:hypothetical protein